MTSQLPIFLTVVICIRNQANQIGPMLAEVSNTLSRLVADYEIVIVDNASNDDSLAQLSSLTAPNGLPNMQIYSLIKEVDSDIAAWVGLENALGDFIAVVDPLTEDINFLGKMLDKSVGGADVVFASNNQKPAQTLIYRGAYRIFNLFHRWFSGLDLAKEAPQFRVLSRRVVNFLLQHPHPALTYRYLPATGGFAKVNLIYSAKHKVFLKKNLGDGLAKGIRMLVSTTQAPMRIVTALSLFGAIVNLIYSGYVVTIAFVKTDVEPGWVSLSLQQSGMFCLISLVLLVLGEYILNMVKLQSEGPLYHVWQEFTSARMTRHERLNVEEVKAQQRKFEPTLE